jgi:tetratricopeptide (TPR) repeat protein
MRLLVVLLSVLAFVSCNRDPNVAKRRYLENGNKYFDPGKYKEARIMYRNALQKDLRYGPAHYRLALAEIKLGMTPQAVGSLRRAVDLLPADQPDHWDAVVRLAEIYLAVTREKQYLDEVEGFTRSLLKRDPNSFDGHRLNADLAYSRATVAFASARKEEGLANLKAALDEYRKADAVQSGHQGVAMQMARVHLGLGELAESEKLYRSAMEKDKTNQAAYTELYRLYLVQNKTGEAEQILKLAFQNNPKQYSFLTLLAGHYYGMKRRDDMVNVLGQIKSHAKDFDQAYLTVGDFYLRMGEGDEAIRQYREGINADAKKKSTYQKRIIEALMRQGKRSEAAEVNSAILKENPNDNDARGLAATFLLDRGDIARALTELQSVVTRAPENFVARYHLGRAHGARGEWEQARQQFAKAVELRPDYVLARLALAQLQVTRREFDAALKSVNEILQIDRQNVNARLIESAALMGLKKFGDSRQLLDQMLKTNTAAPDVLYQLGVVNLAESKFKEAEDAFRRAYQLNPANSRGLMGVVETYMAQNRTDQAIQLLQGEAERAPNRTDYRVALGNLAARTGRYDMAIAEFRKVLSGIEPASKAAGDVHLRIGETLRRKGDLNGAVDSLQKAREAAPENAVVLSTLALALDASGRRQEARQIYEQTLKLDPSNWVVLNNLAFLIAESGGDLDQALTLANRARQLGPNNLPEISDTVGWIYLKKNRSDNAIEIFRDLVNKQPNHSTYRYHLGMALSQKGDKPNAIKELEQALKSNPTKEERDKIQTLINKLG